MIAESTTLPDARDESVDKQNLCVKQSSPTSQIQSPQRTKRTDASAYLSADEKVDIKSLLASRDVHIFPRDEQLDYICVFQGCSKPILRGLCTDEYFEHLRSHAELSHTLLPNMIRRPPSYEGDNRKRRRANSTNSYMLPKRRILDNDKEDNSPYDSPSSSPSDSPPSTPQQRERTNSSDDFNIPLKPSSRGVQLRDQMLRYGLHLFRIDAEGKYICFFDGCSLHMMTNFSRHIAKHEKNGDKIKQELLHLCAPAVIQQQLQQHPSLQLHPSHLSFTHPPLPPDPLQQLLFRQQQEAIQLQQQQQQQLASLSTLSSTTPHLQQVKQMQAHQFRRMQTQHQQQLEILQHSLSTNMPIPSHLSTQTPPHPQLSQQNPSISPVPMMYEVKQPPKPNFPELTQVQNEADLARMRTQISKMLEESSLRPHQKQRSISLAYTSSTGGPVIADAARASFLTPLSPLPLPLSPLPLDSAPLQNLSLQVPSSNESNPSSTSPLARATSSPHLQPTKTPTANSTVPSPVSFPSPHPNSSEIQWIFPKPKTVLSK